SAHVNGNRFDRYTVATQFVQDSGGRTTGRSGELEEQQKQQR
ncbi:MAG: hypothetical protein RLZZ513_163, partial [Pseudomonadota bacterium]